MARIDPKFMLRLPVQLRDQVQAAASANNRSMNAEIVSRLEASFAGLPSDFGSEQVRLIREDASAKMLAAIDELTEATNQRLKQLEDKYFGLLDRK